ncbi:MAG: dihydroorotate dehydrogenase electron transfer subunit [Candidatus Brocadiae bacterium]|nr:dihydroorotate dehydrogenase electron transfer subunit [Candidatus Brocadiia bacterium]
MQVGSHQEQRFRASLPVVLTVAEARRENDEMVTLFFALPDVAEAPPQGLDLDAFRPGRFFMVWLPRLDEKPYTVSYLDGERLGITVQERGPFSARLCGLAPGAAVGMRGPFGRGFWDLERHAESPDVALVGGGCGMAVLAPLADRMPRATVVQGARSAGVLLYTDRFKDQVIFTDDGSAGRKGFPTEWLAERIEAGRLDMVYTCGPEVMMAAVASLCREVRVPCQASLERYMKCGIGVCGQCDCDGRRVCVEGPTFSGAELAEMPSFGRFTRDKTGRRVEVAAADQFPSGPRRQQ